tara:strand:+ start:90 stop:521 length:432 start_codon:yes stop_codon:yes gene_type:complete
MYKKVIVTKEGTDPMKVHYEVGRGIENEEYADLFDKFAPNFSFSLADKMIQEFSTDILPSFKTSMRFTNEDLENMVQSFKNDYKLKRVIKKKPINYFNPLTRRQTNTPKQKNKRKKSRKERRRTQKPKKKDKKGKKNKKDKKK